jgi:adenylate cyclase
VEDDVDQAIAMARGLEPVTRSAVMVWTYATAIPYGVLLPDATAVCDSAETLAIAEHSGDNLALDVARTTHGVTLFHQGGPEREAGIDLLARVRESTLNRRYSLTSMPIADSHIARERARLGDLDAAIKLARTVVDDLFTSGECIWSAFAISVLVDALLQRGSDADLTEADEAIDRLAAVPTDPRFALHEITLLRLRALLARARGDEVAYRDFLDRYRAMATSLGFEGHMKWAEAMP